MDSESEWFRTSECKVMLELKLEQSQLLNAPMCFSVVVLGKHSQEARFFFGADSAESASPETADTAEPNYMV